MWQRPLGREQPLPRPAMHGDGSPEVVHDCWRMAARFPELTGIELFVPENYAPGYAYPLVCYLHDDNGSERDLRKWFPAISPQNYLAAGIRAPFPHPRGLPGRFRWREQRLDAAYARVVDSIATIRDTWNVHPDRITLFGEGTGALVALQQFLLNRGGFADEPVPIAGAICRDLPACWPRLLPPVMDAIEGRVLLLDDIRSGEACAAMHGLEEADIQIHQIAPLESKPEVAINHWLMSAIATAVY